MQNIVLAATILVIGIIISSISPVFLSARNLMNIMLQISVLGTVAAGMSIVMISGGIDLSVGSLISFVGSMTALMIRGGVSEPLAVMVVLLIAIATSAVSGLIIARSRAEPFIITLGLMSIYNGLALLITRGNNVGLSSKFEFLGRGRLLGVIPIPVIVLLVINVVIAYLLKYLKLGRRMYSIGGNAEACYLAGIRVKTTKVFIYAMNGFITGIAAMVLLSRLGSASPIMGNGFEMQSIAACVIGGISLSGGSGKVLGSFLGVLLLGVISNSFNIVGVPSFFQNIFLGLVIIVAVVISQFKFRWQ